MQISATRAARRGLLGLASLATLATFAALAALPLPAAAQDAGSAGAMRERFASLINALVNSPLRRPIHLDSAEHDGRVRADAWGLIDQPYAAVTAAMKTPERWCEALILHVHTRYCNSRIKNGQQQVLVAYIGTKPNPALGSGERVEFVPQPLVRGADYFQSVLVAAEGPLNVRDYRLVLEAIPAGENKTFVHLSTGYTLGLAGRAMTQFYLWTGGRDKVGFTRDAQGNYLGGLRGMAERITLGYFFAVDAFLFEPNREGLDDRLGYWFDATAQYALQLQELERGPYFELKRREYGRQLMD